MQVGEIIQVDKDSFFPADLLLLSVPESLEGICYVETINLDGESNLKIKKGLEQTKELEQLLGTFTVSLQWRLCTSDTLTGVGKRVMQTTCTAELEWQQLPVGKAASPPDHAPATSAGCQPGCALCRQSFSASSPMPRCTPSQATCC